MIYYHDSLEKQLLQNRHPESLAANSWSIFSTTVGLAWSIVTPHPLQGTFCKLCRSMITEATMLRLSFIPQRQPSPFNSIPWIHTKSKNTSDIYKYIILYTYFPWVKLHSSTNGTSLFSIVFPCFSQQPINFYAGGSPGTASAASPGTPGAPGMAAAASAASPAPASSPASPGMLPSG